MTVKDAAYGHEQRMTECDSILPPVVRALKIPRQTKLQSDPALDAPVMRLYLVHVVSSREKIENVCLKELHDRDVQDRSKEKKNGTATQEESCAP